MNTNNRRSFLKNSLIGISGTALIPSIAANAGVKTINELPVRKLGKTGIQVPLISMGTSGASSTGFIKAAYDAGIRLFFSATYYVEGNNEILVGQALKDLPRNSNTCDVNCASGFDIKDRVTDIARPGSVPVEFVRA
jgi:uncharacterized protein